MTFPRRLTITVGATVAVAIAGAYLIRSPESAASWLPLGISVASLAVSILSAFKNELFEFAPRLLGGALMLPQTVPPTDTLQFVLPISFVNTGYAEGVVEWVALKLIPVAGGEAYVCGPIAEVDLTKFIQGRRALHADSILGAFLPFPLESKKSVNKAILFSPEPAPDGKAKPLPSADYRLDVYMKARNGRVPQLMFSIDKAVTPKLLEDFAKGGSIFVTNREIRI